MQLKRIVVATDFTENSLPALEMAFNLSLETQATLYLVNVLEIPAITAPPMAAMHIPIEEMREGALERLEQLIPENWESEAQIETAVLTGPPADTIADFAEEKGADMIIVGTHGRKGLARVFLGSTAESLLREAPCQVLVVKPKHSTEAAHESLETVEAES